MIFFHSDSFFYGLDYHTLEFCVVFWWCSVIQPDYFFVVLLPSLFVVDFGLFQLFSWSSGCWLLLWLWCCGHYRLCPLFCICPSHLQWFLQCFFHTPLRRVCSLLLISPLGFCSSVLSTCMSFPGCWWGWVLRLLWVFLVVCHFLIWFVWRGWCLFQDWHWSEPFTLITLITPPCFFRACICVASCEYSLSVSSIGVFSCGP